MKNQAGIIPRPPFAIPIPANYHHQNTEILHSRQDLNSRIDTSYRNPLPPNHPYLQVSVKPHIV